MDQTYQDIFQSILDDPYDIIPKWQPPSPVILNENLMSVSDMYFYYCNELGRVDAEHKKMIYKNYLVYTKLKHKIKELDSLIRQQRREKND
jgi:hypothetical protein